MIKTNKVILMAILVIGVLSITNTNEITAQSRTLNGVVKKYHDNGKIKSIEHYRNGKRHGWCTYYFKNRSTYGGIKEKTHYKNGKKHGWSFFIEGLFPQPGGRYQFYYVNGVKHGWSFTEKWVGETGYLYEKAMYRNGVKIGKYYQKFHFGGTLNREISGGYYKNGMFVEYMEYQGAPYILCDPTLYMKKIWPSPFFGYERNDYYHSDNLMDEIKETVWVNSTESFGLFPFHIKKDNKKLIKNLVIVNGNRENKTEYYKFSRIKRAIITIEVVVKRTINGQNVITYKKKSHSQFIFTIILK